MVWQASKNKRGNFGGQGKNGGLKYHNLPLFYFYLENELSNSKCTIFSGDMESDKLLYMAKITEKELSKLL